MLRLLQNYSIQFGKLKIASKYYKNEEIAQWQLYKEVKDTFVSYDIPLKFVNFFLEFLALTNILVLLLTGSWHFTFFLIIKMYPNLIIWGWSIPFWLMSRSMKNDLKFKVIQLDYHVKENIMLFTSSQGQLKVVCDLIQSAMYLECWWIQRFR